MACLIKFVDSQLYAVIRFSIFEEVNENLFLLTSYKTLSLSFHIDVWSFFLSQAFLNSLREEGGITFDQLRK